MTLKTPEVTRRLHDIGHGSCFDVILSNCKISEDGTVSSTVNDHEMVYAVHEDDSAKHYAEIWDYRKHENPKSSVGAVFYL